MGLDSDIKKGNEILVNEIERLTQLSSNVKREIENNKLNLIEEEIKNIKKDNKDMKEKLNNLEAK